jgi:hypothetical protein
VHLLNFYTTLVLFLISSFWPPLNVTCDLVRLDRRNAKCSHSLTLGHISLDDYQETIVSLSLHIQS